MSRGNLISKNGYHIDELNKTILGTIKDNPNTYVRAIFLAMGCMVSESCIRSRITMLNAHGYIEAHNEGNRNELNITEKGQVCISPGCSS